MNQELVIKNAKEKFLQEGFVSDFFERADYLIFGVPKNCIEGVLVGREVEKNEEQLNQIKKLFPTCYVCNLDGQVLLS